jgi:glycosyltransferase involved in cell wall biosynthesis
VNLFEIKRANAVIAQSIFQQRILKERFKVSSVIIKNGLALPDVDSEKPMPPVVLWVGSLSKVKKPELFIELAKSIPETRFEMVGGRGTPPQLYDKIDSAAKKVANLTFHGFVPYHKVNEHFKRASLFVSTSRIEGFPNTFIQAWMHYTPVVSLNVDPDDVIRNENLGFCSGSFKQLVLDVTHLLNDKNLRTTMGENGRRYVEKEHDIKKTVAKYFAIFEDLLC